MATYTLIPSSLTGGYNITNASNAYTDTSSTTYASGGIGYGYVAYLGGFDFSVIPSDEYVTALTVKVKTAVMSGSSNGIARLKSSSSSGVVLSDDASIPYGWESVKTLTLTSSVSTIYSYKDTLSIELSGEANYPTMYVYGAEIIVETVPIVPNKITYDGDTLIDLTGDTVTEYDVASGYTFHLPSGGITTGDLIVTRTLTATTSTTSAKTVSFEGLVHEPLWFMLACTNTNTTARSNRIMHVVYDGTTTTVYYGRSSTAGSINSATSDIWTYSSGTITFTSKAYFGAADWTLYYL